MTGMASLGQTESGFFYCYGLTYIVAIFHYIAKNVLFCLLNAPDRDKISSFAFWLLICSSAHLGLINIVNE